MLLALAEALESLEVETLRVALIAGRGRNFCGGADAAELKGLNPRSGAQFVARIHDVCAKIRGLPVPVVAKLHGAVIGAGLEIAAACDLRVAAEGTKFSMPEVRLGIPSVVEAALLPRLMGSGRAAWLVLTGEPVDARRALQWGLVEDVAPDVDLACESLVKSLLAGAPHALREQKRLLQLWEEAPLATSVAASIEAFSRTTIGSTERGKGN